MRFNVVTLFPEMFEGPFTEGVVGRAIERDVIDLRLYNLRNYARDGNAMVDDKAFGGGAGMLLKAEPLFDAVEAMTIESEERDIGPVVLLSPQGQMLNQDVVQELSLLPCVTLICGRYDGVDERVREHLVTQEISVGDYVLSGGELPAMILIDAVSRLVPGVVGSAVSTENDTFSDWLLQHPQYTRPSEYRGLEVPEILLSGNHAEVAKWRRRESLKRTLVRRPDLLSRTHLSDEDEKYLIELGWEKTEKDDEQS